MIFFYCGLYSCNLHRNSSTVNVKRPLLHRAFDWFSFLFGFASLASLVFGDRIQRVISFKVFLGLMPPVDRNYMLVAISIWTTMCLTYHQWALRCSNLQQYSFMAILIVNNDQHTRGIKPKDLGLLVIMDFMI